MFCLFIWIQRRNHLNQDMYLRSVNLFYVSPGLILYHFIFNLSHGWVTFILNLNVSHAFISSSLYPEDIFLVGNLAESGLTNWIIGWEKSIYCINYGAPHQTSTVLQRPLHLATNTTDICSPRIWSCSIAFTLLRGKQRVAWNTSIWKTKQM